MGQERNKILIADDERDIIEFLHYNLEKNGFDVVVARNGKEALELAYTEKPNLILLDIMMPEIDGVEVCRELREKPEFNDTIIAFLTARNEDYSQIAGYEVGADDYIIKPIKPRILIAKLKVLLKRRSLGENGKVIKAGNIEIDNEQHQININGQVCHLPKKEFEILNLLITVPEKVYTREEIYNLVWGQKILVGDRTIDVHIRKIREKIGEDYIKTIKGIGYKFSLP